MTVTQLNPAGTSLSIAWDTTSWAAPGQTNLLHGQGSQLPAAPGGAFGLLGSVCGMGGSPFVWNAVPVATDGTGLIWWLLVGANSTGIEGSWGRDSSGAERLGSGPGGSSGRCGVTGRSLASTCGH